MKKKIIVPIDSEMELLIDALRMFHGFKTQPKLFKFLFLFAALDVGLVPENSAWTSKQRNGWRYCRKCSRDLSEIVLLFFAKRALANTNKKSMTLKELSSETLAEFMPREILIQLAAKYKINCDGLRKSTIIRKVRQYEKRHRIS